MTLTKKLFMINNHQKSWSCYQDFFLLLVLFIYAKKLYNSTNTQFLENFERGFLDRAINIDKTVIDYETYGLETKTAIYGIEYSKYKFSIKIENIKNNIINNLKNHFAIKEYKIVSEGYVDGKNNCYQVLSSFYYGPNLTYNKSFIMINGGNEVIKITCMYNANSKKDDKRIDNIIASVKLIDNE